MWSAVRHLSLALMTSSIIRIKVTPTNRSGARLVDSPDVRHAGTTAAAVVDSAAVCAVRCIRLPVPSVGKTPRFRSCPGATDLYTAMTASGSGATVNQTEARSGTKPEIVESLAPSVRLWIPGWVSIAQVC